MPWLPAEDRAEQQETDGHREQVAGEPPVADPSSRQDRQRDERHLNWIRRGVLEEIEVRLELCLRPRGLGVVHVEAEGIVQPTNRAFSRRARNLESQAA